MLGSVFSFLSRINSFIDRYTPKVSLDTFFESVSDGIDDYIGQAREERYYFIGGKTFFSLDENEHNIIIRIQLYFQVPGEGFKKIENEGEYFFDLLNDESKSRFYELVSDYGEYIVEVEG